MNWPITVYQRAMVSSGPGSGILTENGGDQNIDSARCVQFTYISPYKNT